MKIINRLALAGGLALALCGSGAAQQYKDTGGTTIQGVAPLPFPYAPLSPGQYDLAVTSVTALTAPTGARYAVVCAETATVRYTTDGATTPTSSCRNAARCEFLRLAVGRDGARQFSRALVDGDA